MMHFTPQPTATPIAAPAALFGDLRRLHAADGPAFADHLRRLDAKARRLRFGNVVNDAFLVSYAASTGLTRTVRVGLFEDGTLRGVAELHPDAFDGGAAEGALSLEAPFRRLGYGSRLFSALLEEARAGGIERLTLHCLRENLAMRRLVRRFEGQLGFSGSDVTATLLVP